MTAATLPHRAKTYLSHMTDSQAWDHFAMRPGDIIVATPPKCGTTWTQGLILSLIFGRPGMDRDLDRHSVWLDPGFRDQEPSRKMFDAQNHRRCIKTHTPFDGVPYRQDCSYVAVYRHPLDAHFSFRKHFANMNFDLWEGRIDGTPEDGVARYLEPTPEAIMGDGVTLDGFVHHFQSFRKWAHLPNVHLFHYADMRRDLDGHTSRLAELLDYDHDATLISDIAASFEFDVVQKNARAAAASDQSQSVFKDPAAFFDSATSDKWVGQISEETYDRYHMRLRALLPDQDAAWLEAGGTLP
ncbi:MAG: sulfotransferase domain-containing protein [Pseudomonadota bacterium]